MKRIERKNGLELIDAAAGGNLEAVETLLNAGTNPSLMIRHPNWDKTTALIVAVESKNFVIALLLVTKGADVHFVPPEGGNNAVTRAIRFWWRRLPDESQRDALKELIPLLLAKGARPSPSCLASAARLGDLNMLHLLLEVGVGHDNRKSSDDEPAVRAMDAALAAAVDNQQEETFTELLKAGANPNASVHLKGPCINVAVVNRHRPMVVALIAAKADLNQRATVIIGSFREGRVQSGENQGNIIVHTPASAHDATPLIIAVRCENQEMIQLLVKGGADINATDGDGLTPLAWAVRLKFKEAEDFLRLYGATDAGMEGSPLYKLYHAAAFGNVEKVREALANGADVNGFVARRGLFYTPLIRAARAGRSAVITVLLQAGADPNLAGRESILAFSTTALIMAAKRGHKEIVELLLRAGANPDATTQTPFNRGKGWKAAKYAKDGRHWDIVELLEAASKAQAVKK